MKRTKQQEFWARLWVSFKEGMKPDWFDMICVVVAAAVSAVTTFLIITHRYCP